MPYPIRYIHDKSEKTTTPIRYIRYQSVAPKIQAIVKAKLSG